jgi:hypothetical protein
MGVVERIGWLDKIRPSGPGQRLQLSFCNRLIFKRQLWSYSFLFGKALNIQIQH